MEILLSFVAGLVIAALVAVFVVKKIVRTRTEQAEMSVKLQVESMYKAENASLQSDLKHSEERVKELQGAVEAAKAEGAQQVAAVKLESAKVLESAKKSGYVRVRVDGNMYELSEEIKRHISRHCLTVFLMNCDMFSVARRIHFRIIISAETKRFGT